MSGPPCEKAASRAVPTPPAMVNYKVRPNLYRTLTVIMSDGSTFQMPSAARLVGKALQLERDPANHPLYQVRDHRFG